MFWDKKAEEPIVNAPVCPYCGVEMTIQTYEGYYDTFSYWICDCVEEEMSKKSISVWRPGC